MKELKRYHELIAMSGFCNQFFLFASKFFLGKNRIVILTKLLERLVQEVDDQLFGPWQST